MIKTARQSVFVDPAAALGSGADASAEAASDIAGTVLKIQLGLLSCAFVIAFIIGSLSPARGQLTTSMALPEWNDRVQPWQSEVQEFATRVSAVFGVRQTVALEFSPWILEAASRQQLAPELLAGLVLTESSFRKNVVSPVGAIGPAQVRPEYWSQFCGTTSLDDPAENIYCGAQVLAYYVERCGAEACALSAYNVGPYTQKRQDAGQRYGAKVALWRDRLANRDSAAGSSAVTSKLEADLAATAPSAVDGPAQTPVTAQHAPVAPVVIPSLVSPAIHGQANSIPLNALPVSSQSGESMGMAEGIAL